MSSSLQPRNAGWGLWSVEKILPTRDQKAHSLQAQIQIEELQCRLSSNGLSEDEIAQIEGEIASLEQQANYPN